MAVLDATNRLRARIGLIRQYALAQFDKPTLDAAIAATDDWIEANQAAFNTALPVAFRTNASLAQKTLLFCVVAMRRAGVLKVAED